MLRLAPEGAPDDAEHEHGPACTSLPEFLSTGLGPAFGLLGRQVLLVTHRRSWPLRVVRRMFCSPSNQIFGLLGFAEDEVAAVSGTSEARTADVVALTQDGLMYRLAKVHAQAAHKGALGRRRQLAEEEEYPGLGFKASGARPRTAPSEEEEEEDQQRHGG